MPEDVLYSGSVSDLVRYRKEEFVRVRADAEQALKKICALPRDGVSLRGKAVNWGDLSIVRISWAIDEEGADLWQVWVEECAPGSLEELFYTRMVEKNVEIYCEW